ncbi:MAG: hypothetical protein PF904_17020 [Kiritimatiellae bacterium]|jgi:hypothetical protein|nr:hypothetical protein [Kiritimatiellia bacterium]
MFSKFIVFVLLLLGLNACVSIPPESADLSIELGKRISAIEQSHRALVDAYFYEKRERVNRYVTEKWVPEYAEQIFSDPQIAAVWDRVVRAGSKAERLEFIVTLGPKIQSKINKKRLELIKPLDAAERLISRELSSNYNQARAINNSVTSFLVSSAKVAESRNRYLEMLGVKDEKVGEVLTRVDSMIETLVDKSDKAMSKEDQVKEYLQKFKELQDKF